MAKLTNELRMKIQNKNGWNPEKYEENQSLVQKVPMKLVFAKFENI